MPFANVQGQYGTYVTSGTTCSVTLSAAPTLGNLVLVTVYFYSGSTSPTCTIQDSNGNNYTLSPTSPYQPPGAGGAYGLIWFGYILSAPSNASATITATFSLTVPGTGIALMRAEEFFFGNCTALFDTDIGGTGSGSTTINSPSITPSHSGELLYAFGVPASQIVTANSPWTQDSAGIDGNDCDAEYILSSASGATAINFTANTTGVWSAMAIAFKLVSLTTWNGKTVGSSTGNVSSLDGKTVGTATSDMSTWDGLQT
jgi:hypothetical protein